MVRRPSSPTPQSPTVSSAEKRNVIDRLKRRIDDLRNFEPQSVQGRRSPEVVKLESAIEDTLAAAFGQWTARYNRYSAAADLEPPVIGFIYVCPGSRPQREDIGELRAQIAAKKEQAIVLLQSAIEGIAEELEHEPVAQLTIPIQGSEPAARKPHSVFEVHGHEAAPKAEVLRFIEKLGLEAIILHERPNKGRTLITKFREEAEGVCFAVVLMTPDDLGKATSAANLNPRARQNVVFELGFFVGRLGPDRVAALVKGNIEKPSDFDGVVYISLDSSDWQRQLGQELQEAGYEIDWNKVMRL
jgi:predicted nucleotide-binding protein